MKTIFSKHEAEKLITRVGSLTNNNKGNWGKMNVYQMVIHCIKSEKMYLGDVQLKRLFIGKLFGKLALKGMVNDDKPLGPNKPTHPTFKITGEGNIDSLKEEWIALIKQYNSRNDANFVGFVHPFFGQMNKEQLGIAAFKHIDHHLRQFGA